MIGPLVVRWGDVAWSTPGWPPLVPAAGALLALGLLIAAAVAPRRGGGHPLAAGGVVLLTLFWSPIVASTPALVWGPRGGEDAGPRAGTIFGDLVLADGLGAGATLVLLGLAFAVWLGRPRGGEAPWIGVSLALPALLLALLGLGHAAWLRGLGALPGLGGALPPRIHVGREVAVDVTLLGVDPAGWTVEPVTARPTAPGPVTAEARVHAFGLEGRRTLEALAGEDRFDADVALHVGDTWIYEETTSWRNHYLWVVSAPGRAAGPRTVVRVTGTRETPALRYFTVEVGDSEARTTHEVYGWDGAALVDPVDGGEPTPFLAYAAGEPADADGLVPCTSGVLPGGCRCVRTAPGGLLGLPGPARCEWSTGSAISTGVSAFLAVVTLGLVLEDPDREKRLELVASGRHLTGDPAPTQVP